jgi:hypothetical protein
LLALAQKLLDEYATSIEEDDRLLQSGTLTQNQRAAVIIRKSEKEIIRDLINRTMKLLDEMQTESTQSMYTKFNVNNPES